MALKELYSSKQGHCAQCRSFLPLCGVKAGAGKRAVQKAPSAGLGWGASALGVQAGCKAAPPPQRSPEPGFPRILMGKWAITGPLLKSEGAASDTLLTLQTHFFDPRSLVSLPLPAPGERPMLSQEPSVGCITIPTLLWL